MQRLVVGELLYTSAFKFKWFHARHLCTSKQHVNNINNNSSIPNPPISPNCKPPINTTHSQNNSGSSKFYHCHIPDGHHKKHESEGDLVTMNPKNRRKGVIHKILRRLHIYHTKRVVPKSFKSNLEACLQSVYTGEGEDKHIALKYNVVLAEIEDLQKNIMASNAAMIVDKSSRAHLLVASLVLSTYQVLCKNLEGNHQLVMDILKHCFCRVGLQSIFAEMMVTMPTLALDPISTIATSLIRGANVVGDGWNIHVLQDPPYNSTTVMKVKQCFYHSFFNKNDAPMLTSLFCAMDNKWFAGLDPMHHGVRGTLANGREECSFEFKRMHKNENFNTVDKPAMPPT